MMLPGIGPELTEALLPAPREREVLRLRGPRLREAHFAQDDKSGEGNDRNGGRVSTSFLNHSGAVPSSSHQ